MVLLVTQEKRVLLVKKEHLVIPDLWELSATLDHVESKELRESGVSKAARERREKMDSLASKVTWV